MSEKEVNASVTILILPTAAIVAPYLAVIIKRIREAVQNRLLLPSKEPHQEVHVVVQASSRRASKSLVAFLLCAYTYTADIARIDVDKEYGVKPR